MAAAGPVPAASAHVGNAHKRQSLNFDPYVLSQKLEAARLEQEGGHITSGRGRSTSNAVFVPRSAAKQFAATTTSTTYDAPPSCSKSTRVKRQSIDPVPKESQFVAATVDGKPFLNSKQYHASLIMGMPKNEAAMDRPRSVDLRRQVPEANIPTRSASTNVYRPGDAHKRAVAYAAQHPTPAPQPKRLIAKVHDGETIYAAMDLPEADPFAEEQENAEHHAAISLGRARRVNPNALPYDLPMPSENPADDEVPMNGLRPRQFMTNRPNWAQQSQCGDEMRTHFSLKGSKSKREKGGAGPKRPNALRRHSSAPQQYPEPQSRKKSGDGVAGEETMISDAVKILKKEERNRKRQSLIGFLKKL